MRMVIQDTFEQVHKALLFNNAFPDIHIVLDFTRNGLCAAAENLERANDIFNRLVCDADYMTQMSRLVSPLKQIVLFTYFIFQPRARIPLFRLEVKEPCVAIVQAEFLSIGLESAIIQLVQKQLANYNYTFPRAHNVRSVYHKIKANFLSE
jgi:hypothetical protein